MLLSGAQNEQHAGAVVVHPVDPIAEQVVERSNVGIGS